MVLLEEIPLSTYRDIHALFSVRPASRPLDPARFVARPAEFLWIFFTTSISRAVSPSHNDDGSFQNVELGVGVIFPPCTYMV